MKYGILKLWVSHSLVIVEDNDVLHNINVWEKNDLKDNASVLFIHVKPSKFIT